MSPSSTFFRAACSLFIYSTHSHICAGLENSERGACRCHINFAIGGQCGIRITECGVSRTSLCLEHALKFIFIFCDAKVSLPHCYAVGLQHYSTGIQAPVADAVCASPVVAMHEFETPPSSTFFDTSSNSSTIVRQGLPRFRRDRQLPLLWAHLGDIKALKRFFPLRLCACAMTQLTR